MRSFFSGHCGASLVPRGQPFDCSVHLSFFLSDAPSCGFGAFRLSLLVAISAT